VYSCASTFLDSLSNECLDSCLGQWLMGGNICSASTNINYSMLYCHLASEIKPILCTWTRKMSSWDNASSSFRSSTLSTNAVQQSWTVTFLAQVWRPGIHGHEEVIAVVTLPSLKFLWFQVESNKKIPEISGQVKVSHREGCARRSSSTCLPRGGMIELSSKSDLATCCFLTFASADITQ